MSKELMDIADIQCCFFFVWHRRNGIAPVRNVQIYFRSMIFSVLYVIAMIHFIETVMPVCWMTQNRSERLL